MLGTYVLSNENFESYYLRAQKVRTLINNDFMDAFENVDALISPVTPSKVFKTGEKSPDPLQMYLSDIFTRYLPIWPVFAPCHSLVGCPMMAYQEDPRDRKTFLPP
jgi:Asp-tRNA(Asn)/Glu-tRNA(Gln) amidotransferase A subunit family amidase